MIQDLSFWLFLAIAVPTFWLVPQTYRNRLLAVAGCAYLSWRYPHSMTGMLVVAALVFLLSIHSTKGGHKRASFLLSLFTVLAYLFYFKYFAQLADFGEISGFENIVLPIGISYFSFKLIHLIIEVRRENLPALTLDRYANFLFLVPIFTSGPITRYDNMATHQEVAFRWGLATDGLTRIVYGLIKKFVLAAGVLILINKLTSQGGVAYFVDNLATVEAWKIWAFLVLSYFLVYFDFSAYSDIAIGASRLFGFRVIENFNFPFLAPNIGNHWKRWHISLSTWCQTYIYLPMIGLTRNPYLAVLASFTVMGLWHAGSWNFIFWGWYNALGIMVFQYWSQFRRKRRLRWGETGPLSYTKYLLTFLFFSGSFAFSSTHGIASAYDAIRLLARAFAVSLPAFS
jgi:alginate O-acetyltransferase complex protein AlgI